VDYPGHNPEVQNLSVAFSVPWFPKDLIIHPLPYIEERVWLVVGCSKVEKFSGPVVYRVRF
jgi:hypothetical protein